jgi:glycerol kinase
VVWDRASGAALSPLVVWSDLRGVARARELGAHGYMLAPQQAAAKLEAIFAGVQAPPARLAWGNIDSYLIFRLTGGAHLTDRSQAWPSGYLALPDLGWNEALIDHQGLERGAFPALVDTWGELAMTAPSVFGAAAPIAADIADQQSALIAHGAAPGTAKVTFGTSATFDLMTGRSFVFPSPGLPPLVVSSVAGKTDFCVEGMVLSAGSALDWLRGALCLGDQAAFGALAGSVGDSAGAAFLPALQGLGAPAGDPNRRAALTGLSTAVSRAHLARAGLEGLVFRVREIVEAVYAAVDFDYPQVLGVDGGLTRSEVFVQILADLVNRPVRRTSTPEATLLGAAKAAARGIGRPEPVVAFAPPVTPRLGPEEAAARFAAWRGQVYG